MSSEQNKALVRRAYETISEGVRKGDMTGFEEVTADGFVDHNPDPGQGPGREGAKQWFLQLARGFPDLRITVDDLISEGDRVAARVTFRGTHQGEFQGIAPTGKEIEIPVIDILRIEDGKVAERWGQADELGLLRQMGASSS